MSQDARPLAAHPAHPPLPPTHTWRTQGNILDDEELINTLAVSKVTSNEISAKVAEAEVTEKQIDETRELYRPVVGCWCGLSCWCGLRDRWRIGSGLRLRV